MSKRFEHPIGTCSRCGKVVVNGDWIKYCRFYHILGEDVILHFCKGCYIKEEK